MTEIDALIYRLACMVRDGKEEYAARKIKLLILRGLSVSEKDVVALIGDDIEKLENGEVSKAILLNLDRLAGLLGLVIDVEATITDIQVSGAVPDPSKLELDPRSNTSP